MRLAARLTSWTRSILRRKRIEAEMDAELRFHIEARSDDLFKAGISRPEAIRQAQIDFGGIESAKEECRESRGLNVIDACTQDLRFGLRMLRKNPGFTLAAVLALAIGIASNTAVFTALNAILFRPRSIAHPEEMARVFRATPNDPYGALSYTHYLYFRDHSQSFADLILLAYGLTVTSSDFPVEQETAPTLAGAVGFRLPQLLAGSARPMNCAFISGNYFETLGARPIAGRLLARQDDRRGSANVVVMSGNFWRREFHADPAVVGSTLHLNNVAFTVIGVTPVDYLGTAPVVPDLWAPISAKLLLGTEPKELSDPQVLAGWVEGRLKPGVSFKQAESELNVLAKQIRPDARYPGRESAISVISGRTFAPPLQPAEWAIVAATMTAVVLLLLIACANVGSLLLARSAARRREIAVRLSLGAPRARVLQQLLTESLLIGLLAGAAALPFSWWAVRALILQIAGSVPKYWGGIVLQVSPDARIFAYTLSVAVLSGVLFGLLPALQALRTDVNAGLRNESGFFAQPPRRVRGFLIASQMTACVVLLISSALLLRGSQRALRIDPGFNTRDVIYLELQEPRGTDAAKRSSMAVPTEFAKSLRRLQGVRTVAEASRAPLAGGNRWVDVAASDSGRQSSEPGEGVISTGYSCVGAEYFDAMGIRLARGHSFTRDEIEGHFPVAVISQALAQHLWPNQDPIGKHVRIGREQGSMSFPGERDPFIASSEVIGVAPDVRSLSLRETDNAYVYLPLDRKRWNAALLVRAEANAPALLPILGAEARRLHIDVPVLAGVLHTMISFDPFFVISRIGGVLATIVGLLGLGLACTGVYGTVAYAVVQRRKEIGIRLALGADRKHVLRLTFMDGMKPVLAGAGLGVLAATGASRGMSAVLFGLSANDWLSFGGVSLLLISVAAMACYIPARRAMRVDPMVALRYE